MLGRRIAGGGIVAVVHRGPSLQCGSCVLRKQCINKLGGPDTTSTFTLLLKTCRGNGLCWLLPRPLWFLFPAHRRIGPVPVCNRKCSSLADMLRFCHTGLPYVLMLPLCSSLTTQRRPSSSDLSPLAPWIRQSCNCRLPLPSGTKGSLN